MRQSKLTDEQLQQLADDLRAIASKFDPAIVEELIDRRFAMDQPPIQETCS